MRNRHALLGVALGLALVAPSAASAQVDPSAGTPLYPDIVEALPAQLQIQKAQQRDMLRFTTVHLNVGAGPLQVRGGGQIAPCVIDGILYDQCTVATKQILDAQRRVAAEQPAGTALFHPQHNHWHQGAVALFDLRSTLNDPATALANGVYYLTHTADPENHWAESDEDNNFAWVKVRIYTQGGNRKVSIIDHSPCEPVAAVCDVGGNP